LAELATALVKFANPVSNEPLALYLAILIEFSALLLKERIRLLVLIKAVPWSNSKLFLETLLIVVAEPVDESIPAAAQ